MNKFLKFILLAIPYFFMVLGIGIYNRVNPEVGGWPFFYWYQLLWIFIAAAITKTVYYVEKVEQAKGSGS